jgi:hypothetical protein
MNPGPPEGGAETAPLPLPWIVPVTVTVSVKVIVTGSIDCVSAVTPVCNCAPLPWIVPVTVTESMPHLSHS